MLLLALAAPAHAGYSTDIELVRPYFSGDTLPGFDGPGLGRPGTVRVGTLVQYERDPLLLYRVDDEIGTVVHNRAMSHLGASVDFSRRLSARISLPIGGQWGADQDRLAADIAGFGDLSAGMRIQFLDAGPLLAAARLDLVLPVGTPDAWLGESGLRAVGGVVAQGRFGPVRIIADASVVGRAPIETGEDFDLGSELALNGLAMLDVWPDRVSVGAGFLSRGGIANLYEGGAENPVELLAGAQLRPLADWQVDFGMGRGIASGYGTTQIRAYAGLTWMHVPPPAREAPVAVVAVKVPPPPLPDDLMIVAEPEPPKPLWKPDELARVEEEQIIIRDPIQFEVNTARILPESLDTLRAIAALLHDHPEILYIVIEGHASEEGTFVYNFELSIQRSIAIFRELIVAGVHPERLSCRGMGEVVPAAGGTEEASLAINRRVIFHIVRRLAPGESGPALTPDILLPWSGDAARIDAPPPPPPPAPEAPPETEKKKDVDPGIFRDDEEE